MTDVKIPGGVVITRNDVEDYKREILDQSLLVRPKEAAAVLACSTSTVQNLVRDGRLTAYSNNRVRSKGVRILASELRDYVRSMRVNHDDWAG